MFPAAELLPSRSKNECKRWNLIILGLGDRRLSSRFPFYRWDEKAGLLNGMR